MKPTYIQVLIKRMLEARIKQIVLFERRGSVHYFDVLHVQIIIQQNILGAMKIIKNTGGGWQLFSKNAGGERVKLIN